jgi:hypothetical protein
MFRLVGKLLMLLHGRGIRGFMAIFYLIGDLCRASSPTR